MYVLPGGAEITSTARPVDDGSPISDRPWTLIANPAAGGGRARRLAEHGRRRLRQAGVDAALAWTQRRGQARELAAAAVDRGSPVAVVCGGDGTVSEVLPELAGRETRLGLLPAGTCNDLARSLGVPTSPEPALRLLADGRSRPIDLGRCGRRWFATVASFGFDAEVGEAVAAGRSPFPGTAGYLYAALRHLRTYRPPRVRLRGDFGVREQEVFLAAAANTACYGGGMRICPQADPADGRLDVCLVDGSISRGEVLAMLPRIFRGGHVRSPAVHMLRSSWVEIEPLDGGSATLRADGEHLAETPAVLRASHHALRVIRPASP